MLFESFAEYESLYTSDGFAATAITNDQIALRLTEGPVWVAVSGETIVGSASVNYSFGTENIGRFFYRAAVAPSSPTL